MRRLALVLAVGLLTLPALAADYVWLEGEAPTSCSIEVQPSGWGNTQFLSLEKWLHISIESAEVEQRCPPEGIVIAYDFAPPAAGRYEVWNRIGFEFVRSPCEWRVDDGPWRTISPDELTTDLMEIAEWCEVAWLKLGDADLDAGRHRLEIRLPRTYTETDGQRALRNILYASDALCLYQGAFRPNSFHQPDEAWQTEVDMKAAQDNFRLPPEYRRADGRVVLPLDGLWQVCRWDEQEIQARDQPSQTLPDLTTAHWMAIPVPGNKFAVKPELRLCHRFIYRARIEVPAEAGGQSFVLRFPSLSMIASVFVNGQYCGGTRAPFALWECDITGATRAGQVNEVCVVVKDAYYAFSPKKLGQSCRMRFNVPVGWMGSRNYINQTFDFPVGAETYAQSAGILEAPSLIVTGPVYAADVFVRPSTSRKELAADVTLRNPGGADRRVTLRAEAVPVGAGGQGKALAPQEITVPAGGEQRVTLAEPWANPRLWWPDDPYLYDLVTTVTLDGQTVEARRTRFGFREWGWSGRQFTINGVPWQFWADTTLGDGGRDPEQAITTWRKSGQNMWRFWGRTFGGLSKEQALDLMDARGIVVRRSGIFDGQGANYLHGLTDNKELFDNWIEQMRAWVKEERNHPAVLIWSLENEITFINSRNLGQAEAVEPEIARGAREVMALDPTRPVMVDGGNCLMDKSLPVNGVHYMESYWRDYPDEAYTLEKAYQAHEADLLPGWGKCPWQLVPDRPIFMGESFYARGSTPSAYAQFGGEACFQGWGPATRVGVGRLAKILAEGYRWHGVAAHHFWLSETETDLHHNSWRPVALLCREWNWTFAGGEEVSRTLKVFNNTHLDEPIEAVWALLQGGKVVVRETRTCALPPGGSEEFGVRVTMPSVGTRTAGEFVLKCSRGGQELFRESKPVALIPADAGPKPGLVAAQLVVVDPAGTVRARLQARGIPFTAATGLADLPATARAIVVGPNALSPADATDPRWLALAAAGKRVLVLEQATPLHFQALPADLAPTDHVGRIAFPENLAHPAFAGLGEPDFFTWSGDHVVYRNSYRKAAQGAVSLAQCDDSLGDTALAECPVNDGLMVLCQMVVGEKLATDPVAQRLFDNLLAYCATYEPVRRTTAVVMDSDSPAFRLLSDSGLQYDTATDVLAAIGDGHDIVIFAATPDHLRALAAAPDQMRAFTARGGWLMAWGLSPQGLADFNRLVGVEHLLRPFELERVSLPAVRDPLLAGLTARDVTMESAEKIFPWAGDMYLVDDEFTYVVDLDDIAPFAEFPDSTAGDHAAAKAREASWPRNLVNGFTSADAWKLIHYLSTSNPRVTLTLPRPERITRLSLVLNTHYSIPTQVKLTFDDDPTPVVLTTRPDDERQDFDLEPRQASRLTVELAAFDKPGQTTGLDNLWLTVERPADWRQRVVPLLSTGGLVKYPMGEGGLILNQLNIKDSEAVPQNVQKKRTIVTTLLRNLHAAFAGGKLLTTADLRFTPVPFNERCNAYVTRDRGWYESARDLAHLPRGEVVLGGVPYEIRDFKTSPLPACVMLAGPGTKEQLPAEVRDLPVGHTADALYFLHTLNRGEQWRPAHAEDTPPVAFEYVVNYADGQTATVPVVYGEGVDHWVSAQPTGLRNASVAWHAPFPGDSSGEEAVLYQMPWVNPRPEVEVTSIGMRYGPDGSRYGTPALLALTLGSKTP